MTAKTDSTTGKPVDIIISPKKIITNSEVLTVPNSTGTTGDSTITLTSSAPAATGDEAAPETVANDEEKKEEGAEASTAASGEEEKA